MSWKIDGKTVNDFKINGNLGDEAWIWDVATSSYKLVWYYGLNEPYGPVHAHTPVYSDSFTRANANFVAPWTLAMSSMPRVVGNQAQGPASGYGISHYQGASGRLPLDHYSKVTYRTPVAAPLGNLRLEIRAGIGSSGMQASALSVAFSDDPSMSAKVDDTHSIVYLSTFRATAWIDPSASVAIPKLKNGDVLMAYAIGRTVYAAVNGIIWFQQVMADADYYGGGYAGVGADANYAWDDWEAGYINASSPIWKGDDFEQLSQYLSYMWYQNGSQPLEILNGRIQEANNTVSGITQAGLVGDQMATDDFVVEVDTIAANSTNSTNARTLILGRCGTDAFESGKPLIAVSFNSASIRLSTLLAGVETIRGTYTATIAAGSVIELQCVGNVYHMMLNGIPLLRWIDDTNIVERGVGRRGYGIIGQTNRTTTSGQPLTAAAIRARDLVFTATPNTNPNPTGSNAPGSLNPAGGATFRIFGDSFSPTSKVYVGNTIAATTFVSENILQFVTPGGSGVVPITIVTPGRATVTVPGQFWYTTLTNQTVTKSGSQTLPTNGTSAAPVLVQLTGYAGTEASGGGIRCNGKGKISVTNTNTFSSTNASSFLALYKNGVEVARSAITTLSATTGNVPWTGDVELGDILTIWLSKGNNAARNHTAGTISYTPVY